MKQSWKYHKIMSIYKRHPETNKFLIGEYSTPEIEYLKDLEWEFTEKIDGTNIRIKYDGKDVEIAGRSDEASLPVFLLNRLIELFKSGEALNKLKEVFSQDGQEDINVCLYGEGFGAKIQKGGGNYIKDGVDFVLFDICINGTWLKREDVNDIAKKLNLQVVPVIGKGTLDDAIEMTKKGLNSQWGNFIAEGIVARPSVELFTRRHDRVIVKVKYKDFH